MFRPLECLNIQAAHTSNGLVAARIRSVCVPRINASRIFRRFITWIIFSVYLDEGFS